MTTCGGSIYLANKDNKVFSSSMEDFLMSTNSSDGGSVWTRLSKIPIPWWSTLATLREHVLAIGINLTRSRAIHWYDVATKSLSVIGEMPTSH